LKQVFLSYGKIIIEDVPVPIPKEGEILVQTAYSLISLGAELSTKKYWQSLPYE
jgi:hypothetical protein